MFFNLLTAVENVSLVERAQSMLWISHLCNMR